MDKIKRLAWIAARGSLFLLFAFLQIVSAGRAADSSADETIKYLKRLSIEELATLEVTSVSKTPERLTDAAAAVFVITAEDIRRGGFTSIAESLRMAPGMHVARIDANKWAISSRGFNGIFANKLLVMIDGRSVYTPLYSGVFWDVQDTLLEDIDRIEVIRGPGATLWGANAVNGIINIITKKARDTQGGLLSAGGGTLERRFGVTRYGAKVGENAWCRVYAKYFNRDGFKDNHGDETADDWESGRGGFRLDWDKSASDSLTLQGDIYGGNTGTTNMATGISPLKTVDTTTSISGGNLLGRWRHRVSETSDLALQIYYDHTYRDMVISK